MSSSLHDTSIVPRCQSVSRFTAISSFHVDSVDLCRFTTRSICVVTRHDHDTIDLCLVTRCVVIRHKHSLSLHSVSLDVVVPRTQCRYTTRSSLHSVSLHDTITTWHDTSICVSCNDHDYDTIDVDDDFSPPFWRSHNTVVVTLSVSMSLHSVSLDESICVSCNDHDTITTRSS